LNLKETLARFLPTGGDVTLSLDMDEPGQAATLNLLHSLADEPYTLKVAQWNPKDKGPDDAFRARQTLKTLTANEWLDLTQKEDTIPPPEPMPAINPPGSTFKLYSGSELLNGEFPSPPMIVPELIPTGLSLLAGKSKIGKSFFVLDLCISVATGSPFLSEDIVLPEGKVLYLAFEDVPRSIKKRLASLMKGREHLTEKINRNLIIAPSTSRIPRMPAGMIWLRKRLEEEQYSLVVIDTLERFRPTDEDGSRHSYSGDYTLLEELKTWCEERGVAVLLVHHVRKNIKDADDIFDSVLGSTGILGCPDTLLLLTRKKRDESEGKLHAAGREVQSVDYRMWFDMDSGQWSVNPEEETQDKKAKASPVDFLVNLFNTHPQMLANDVIASGAEKGFSGSMLKRFKDKLPFVIESKKIGNVWYWLKQGGSDATPVGREEAQGDEAGD